MHFHSSVLRISNCNFARSRVLGYPNAPNQDSKKNRDWEKVMTVSEKLQSGNRPDYTSKKKTKLGLCLNLWTKELHITSQNFCPKFDKLSCENRILCLPSQYLNFVMGIANTPYLLADNGLGDGDGIDCFVMPQEMSTPGISVIYATDFLDFRIDFSIDMPPNVTGFTWHGLSRRLQLRLQKF